jgi:ABC-type transport system involved in cytochrome c biogenesis permease subunit
LAIYAIIVPTYIEKWGLPGPEASRTDRSELGWLMMLALLAVASPLVSYSLALWKNSERFLRLAYRCVFVSILLQGLALAGLLARARNGGYPAPSAEGTNPATLAVNPFILTGLVGGILISLLFLLLVWRRPDLERLLPNAGTLDHITYKTICLAFPLLTLTIATGAYWANLTWGSYWSWDPKETWAAITWLVYALYLHMRITVGWRGRRAAYFAIAGFAVVIFTFFGVTYLLRGMHAFS